MAFTPEQEAALLVLLNESEKIISDLELAGPLAGDMLLPVENGAGTFAASVDDIKDYVTPPDSSTTEKGIVEIATDAEVAAGSDGSRTIVPSSLLSLFPTSTLSSASANASLPLNISSAFGELIIKAKQDTVTIPAGGSATDIAFDTPFPNACIAVSITPKTWSGSNPAITQLYVTDFQTTKFVASNPDGDTNCTGFNYIAIGY